MYCDAHLHLVDLDDREPGFAAQIGDLSWCGAVDSHDPAEFLRSENFRKQLPPTLQGFGIHPQNPDMANADFLVTLIQEKRISFIGEAGFDFFGDTPVTIRSAQAITTQTEAFLFQCRMAAAAQLPLVLHIRKATDILMQHWRQLVAVPRVVLHCWPGRLEEARMLLSKGIEAWFSFGTPLLRGSPHALESLRGLPQDRILAETDAPWQPPHGQPWTRLQDIVRIVRCMAAVLEIPEAELEERLMSNFIDVYGEPSSRPLPEKEQSHGIY